MPPPPPKKRIKKPSNAVPLGTALSRLISNAIKRDQYGFFSSPVDENEVPGYRLVVTQPMDLGTMSAKVERGEYPDVDAFKVSTSRIILESSSSHLILTLPPLRFHRQADFLLVTKNAKTFNPPENMYHGQAQKLEDWGLKAIEREEAKGISLPQTDAANGEDGDASMEGDQSAAASGSSNGKKRSYKSRKDTGSSRSSSRPAVSSALSRPPLSLDEGSPEAQRYIKREDGEDEEQEASVYDYNDEDNDEDGSPTRQAGSVSGDPSQRGSTTPGPGGAAYGIGRRRYITTRGKAGPRRNAPPLLSAKSDQGSMTAAILHTRNAAKADGVDLTIDEAALQTRASVRDGSSASRSSFPYRSDGALDLEAFRYGDRVDLFGLHGLVIDPASGAPRSDSASLPQVTSVYPLHPDAQKHLEQLERKGRKDPLSLATAAQVKHKEDTASHYVAGLPLGYRRMPISLPTSAIEVITTREGKRGPADRVLANPYKWPQPSLPSANGYEPTPLHQLDHFNYPRPSTNPNANKTRNKDLEREIEGMSTLTDWTSSHGWYSRIWDGVGDLGIWKGGFIEGSPPVPPPGQQPPKALDGSFDKWEEARVTRMAEVLRWEEREAVQLAASVLRPEDLGGQDGIPIPDVDAKVRLALLRAEKARQTCEAYDEWKKLLWGASPMASSGLNDAELWARSVEEFVIGASPSGAPADIMGDIDEWSAADHGTSLEGPSGSIASHPQDQSMEALFYGTLLDRSLYDYTREAIVQAHVNPVNLSAVVSAGRWLLSHDGPSLNKSDDVQATSTLKAEDITDDILSELQAMLSRGDVEMNGAGQSQPTERKLAATLFETLYRHLPRLIARRRLLSSWLDAPVTIDETLGNADQQEDLFDGDWTQQRVEQALKHCAQVLLKWREGAPADDDKAASEKEEVRSTLLLMTQLLPALHVRIDTGRT